jgi:hypothetical protein
MLKNLCLAAYLGAGLVIAGCAAPAPEAVAADQGFASPQDLLNELYSHYADKPAGSGLDIADEAVIAKYFTPELAARINQDSAQAEAKGEVPALDGDPFVASQDWQVTDLQIAVGKSAEPDKTTAHVTFKNYDEVQNVTLLLAKTAQGWQIADIDWGYDKLSKILPE